MQWSGHARDKTLGNAPGTRWGGHTWNPRVARCLEGSQVWLSNQNKHTESVRAWKDFLSPLNSVGATPAGSSPTAISYRLLCWKRPEQNGDKQNSDKNRILLGIQNRMVTSGQDVASSSWSCCPLDSRRGSPCLYPNLVSWTPRAHTV